MTMSGAATWWDRAGIIGFGVLWMLLLLSPWILDWRDRRRRSREADRG